jgi:poly-beta-1,6-N-acetyl-D-glucosamine N-deacetylase
MRKLVFRALRLSFLPVLFRETLQRRRVTIVLYHDPDPRAFEHHLSVLKRHYSIIDLRAFVDVLGSANTSRLPRKSLVITLDDGHRRNRALLPVLERADVPVTIFLCASIVGSDRLFWFKHVEDPEPLKRIPDAERLDRLRVAGVPEYGEEREALSDEEIREMSGRYFDFQSHGRLHPILPRCDDEMARAEVLESRGDLASRYGLDIYAFSYPNGDYSDRELRLVRDAGYRCAVTVEPGFNSAGIDPYRLRRICIDDPDGIDELLVKSSGLWGAIRGLSVYAAAVATALRRGAPRT